MLQRVHRAASESSHREGNQRSASSRPSHTPGVFILPTSLTGSPSMCFHGGSPLLVKTLVEHWRHIRLKPWSHEDRRRLVSR